MKLNAPQLGKQLKDELAPVYVVSGDDPLLCGEACDLIRQACRAAGLPRTDASDKTARREAVAAGHRLLLLIGDSGGDFHASLAGEVESSRAAVEERFADRWGESWIVLPNPMYGSWSGEVTRPDIKPRPLEEGR